MSNTEHFVTNVPKDRRVRRTRQALHGALIDLILEKGYDAVSITDIVKRANVGRSTFYAHFDSKEALFTSELDSLRSFLSAEQDRVGRTNAPGRIRTLAFSAALFDHAKDYREVYLALVGRRGGNLLTQQIEALLRTLVRQDFMRLEPPKADIPREALVAFVVSALMAIMAWWLEGSPTLPSVEADGVFRDLVLPSLGF